MNENYTSFGLETAFLPTDAESRSISAENFTGEKGRGGMSVDGEGAGCASELGQTWKVSPNVYLHGYETFTMADFKGEGVINHIWFADCRCYDRALVLRMYWDGSDVPSVEVPLTDFFAVTSTQCYSPVNSLPVCFNPLKGMNCYWKMPFYKGFRITVENQDERRIPIYYQIDFELKKLPEGCRHFHAQYRQACPVGDDSIYTVLDNVRGSGSYVGTYMYYRARRDGWWGEGEFKFYLDGDTEFPTICGTGTEDYFLGTHGFEVGGQYSTYSTAFGGMTNVISKDNSKKTFLTGQAFSMYRWHLPDPVHFKRDFRLTVQDLGWIEGGGKYFKLHDDISTVAYWYQDGICGGFPKLPTYEEQKIMLT